MRGHPLAPGENLKKNNASSKSKHVDLKLMVLVLPNPNDLADEQAGYRTRCRSSRDIFRGVRDGEASPFAM